MSRVKARYFDGKTSKPKEVWVKVFSDSHLLFFYSEESAEAFDRWNLDCVKQDSFNSSDGIQLSYIDDKVRKSIEINEASEQIIRLIKGNHSSETKLFDLVLKHSAYKVIASGILVLSILIFVYVKWVSVLVGNAIVSIIPLSVEEIIGNTAYNQMNPFLDIDSTKSVLLQDFYNELNFDSEYQIAAYFDTNKTVNAFALPGGKIVVYKGIVQKTESWQELAALFGHEISHVNKQHSMRLMSRELGNYAVFSAITGDMAGISSVIVESAISLNELVYSRTYEKEADFEGLELLISNDIEPASMKRLFERLLEENKEVEEFLQGLEMLSTHPLSDNRINYIQERISEKGMTDFKGFENERAKNLWLQLKE